MATKSRHSTAAILEDSRKAIATARKQLPAILKGSAGRARKLLDKAALDKLATSLSDAKKLSGGQLKVKVTKKGATKAERDTGSKLFDELANVREDVALAFDGPEHRTLRQAFGEGRKLHRDSTPELSLAADAIVEAFSDPTFKKSAKEAGVTDARVRELAKLGRALEDADSYQASRQGEGKGATLDLEGLLRQLSAGSARIRRVAKRVFKNDAKALAEFGVAIRGARAPGKKRRAPKSSSPAAPSTPPSKPATP